MRRTETDRLAPRAAGTGNGVESFPVGRPGNPGLPAPRIADSVGVSAPDERSRSRSAEAGDLSVQDKARQGAEDAVEEIERSAASVEEAIEAALADLGISEQEARIQILQEPRPGSALSAQAAVVRVRPAPSAPSEDERAEQAEAAAAFLRGLLQAMELDADVESPSEITYVDIWSTDSDEDMGLLIGKGGHTLDALQELVRGSVQRLVEGRCLVQVDVEDYRKRQRSRIAARAREVARRVKKSGRPESLDPMPAFERKVVHDTVSEIGGLETASEGEEPNRRVVIRRAAR